MSLEEQKKDWTCSQRGVTLLDVVIALVLGGLLLAIALASWNGAIRERRVVRVAEDIAGLLRFAQQSAVADSVEACGYRVVILSTRAEARKVARDDDNGGCESPELVTTVRVTDQFPKGVEAVVIVVPPGALVQFTSAGSLSGVAAVTIAVSSGDRRRSVLVDPVTGRVEVTQ
mgnify:CR=1 FL=1